MRQGGGKSKGAQYEREVVKALSLWASNGTREDLYWRSSMSGGRATVSRRKGVELNSQAGDLSCINPLGQSFTDMFYVEIKHYRDLNLLGLLNETGNLIKFWRVAVKEANSYEKLPLLIAKQNRLPALAFMTRHGLHHLGLDGNDVVLASRYKDLNGVLFKEFLEKAVLIGG